MIIDFLISRDGLRIDEVDLRISGVRLAKKGSGLEPEVADLVEGSVRLTLNDLAAAFARPEILDQLLSGVSGIARPEVTLSDAGDGIRITGSIEIMGRRFPITAFSRLSIEKNRVLVSATQLEGLPMLGVLSSRLPSIALPLTLPAGLRFTDVVTESGAVVVSFEGHDVRLGAGAPTPKVDPATKSIDAVEADTAEATDTDPTES
ncbi:MAG: LmeA family phospholipid-binding protein [Jatrophihabitans sp.]